MHRCKPPVVERALPSENERYDLNNKTHWQQLGVSFKAYLPIADEYDHYPHCQWAVIECKGNSLRNSIEQLEFTAKQLTAFQKNINLAIVIAGKDYRIIGEPVDFESAVDLMRVDPTGYQFQLWALSLVDAWPARSRNGKEIVKGADKGVDGWLTIKESDNLNLQRIVVQVKGGHVGAQDVRDLIGTVQSSKAAMGILITLHEPTEPMKQAAFEAEYYESPTWGHKYPKIQILTIPELLKGSKPILPHTH